MNRFEKVNEIIRQHDSIVIYRHVHSDYDAYGSSLGLKHLLLTNYPEKKIYCVGLDDINNPRFLDAMDDISDETIAQSLAIIVDTSTADRVEFQNYLLAKDSIRIDHHPFTAAVARYEIIDDTASSACQLIAELAIANNWAISRKAAGFIYAGMSTDTLKMTIDKVDSRLFRDIAVLMESGIRLNEINRHVYDVDINTFKTQTYFRNNIEFAGNCAWLKITIADMEANSIDFRTAKDMVNLMSNITGVDKYLLFTETDPDIYSCSLRAHEITISDIAREYGGGGHLLASGIPALTPEQVEEVIVKVTNKE